MEINEANRQVGRALREKYLTLLSGEIPAGAKGHPATFKGTISVSSLYSPWRRWLFLAVLFLVTTSNYFDYYVISVVLEPIKREFRVSDTMLGLLSGFFFSAIYAIAGLPIARLADRGNRRTIITIAIVGWSIMTTACGLAHTFWQLALARFGLGMAEPGALPPAHSLIGDYFPSEQRATAVAVLNSGSAAGWLVGVGLGGYIAATRGWRSAFLLAGALGFILALVVRVVLREPRSEMRLITAALQPESLVEAVVWLARKKSFSRAVIGISVYGIFTFGVTIFLPSFMIRILHATLEQVSVTWGVAISASNLVGALVGGWWADLLSRRDVRWYAWLPAVACALSGPVYWLAFNSDHLWTFVCLDAAAESILSIGIFSSFAALHVVCGSSRRAVAIAIAIFSFTLIGGGFGPLITGVLSDLFSESLGPDGLRCSLWVMLVFLLPAACAFYSSGKMMPPDLEG